jgi:hypothetical protein
LANYLLQGDKGFNVLDLFELLELLSLELIDMVNWQSWQVWDLLQNQAQLPEYLDMILSMATPAQYLHLFELLNPIHRTLDFWCGHAGTCQGLSANRHLESANLVSYPRSVASPFKNHSV